MKLTFALLAFVATVIAAPIAAPEAEAEAAPEAQGTYGSYGRFKRLLRTMVSGRRETTSSLTYYDHIH
jgi:hypothetical protein